jgi:hypothetical protein
LTYEEHVKNFWSWILGIPKGDNPAGHQNDPSGKFCSIGQSASNSSIFYLSFNDGGNSERSCKVPAGKGLFIPVMQVEWSKLEAPGSSLEQLDKLSRTEQDRIGYMSLTIGDRTYRTEELKKYRVHTTPFKVVFADPPIFGVKGGLTETVADGYYVITEPLARGNYTVHFRSGLMEGGFAQDIKYNLMAQ